MPRVSEQHRKKRRQQILKAARNCFSRNGFHATSMDDVILSAGLSAGAVYSYFKGKEEIVLAVVEEILEDVLSRIRQLSSDPLHRNSEQCLNALLDLVRDLVSDPDHLEIQRIAILAWGEAIRNSSLQQRIAEFYGAIRMQLEQTISLWQEAGAIPNTPQAAALGRITLGVLPALYVQNLILGQPAVDGFIAALRSLLVANWTGAAKE